MHACVHANTYLCIHVLMYICVCVLVEVVCMCLNKGNMCAHVCVQVCTFVCKNACTHFHASMHKQVYIHVCICICKLARVCACFHVPTLGLCCRRGNGTMDSRNFLSFQAMRPSAHQISTSNVPTTPWVRAACCLLPYLSITLLFISLSTLLLTALASFFPGEGFFLGVEPYATFRGLGGGSEDLCRYGHSGKWQGGSCREPRTQSKGLGFSTWFSK